MVSKVTEPDFFDYWLNSPENRGNVTYVKEINQSAGEFSEFLKPFHTDLVNCLQSNKIFKLFSHQHEAIQLILLNKNVAVTSGPSSGKSLIYLLPILNDIFFGLKTTSLLIFPTKALAYDQLQHIYSFLDKSHLDPRQIKDIKNKISVYDGDTPTEIRTKLRKNSQIILTNPDMIHYGILPNHDLWENFFDNLKFVILDEAHVYSGIFGSHVANVIRRLKRINTLYNKPLIFICTTATIGNPQEFLNKLVEADFELISEDGSPKAYKRFVFYNPPIVNQELGIRKSSHQETLRITEELTKNGIQILVFQGSRKEVEKSLKYLQQHERNTSIASYRSGYLAQDRRKIEEDFRDGSVKALFTTNALELGIDIGKLQCVILSGYPGSISSTWQQMGRSGRSTNDSIAIFIASSNPIDQFIINRPEYLYVNNPENALINPNNPNILIDHLMKSIMEVSLIQGEKFGNLNWGQIEEIVNQLISLGIIAKKNDKYILNSPNKPIEPFSIRNMNSNTLKLIDISSNRAMIGEIDYASSFWMVHPHAIYLHLGEQYKVTNFNLDDKEILLEKSDANYYTEPILKTTYEILSEVENKHLNELATVFGQILVTTRVTGYKEILWESNQRLNVQELELPETKMETEAFWFNIPEKIKEELIKVNLWLNYQNDYGPGWAKYSELIRKRDNFTCQKCGALEEKTKHHVHHIKPIKLYESIELANSPSNLITLCASCHRSAELQVRVRSGLAGLSYLLKTLSPLFVMSSIKDLNVVSDSKKTITGYENSIIVFDNIPFGLGLSKELFNKFPFILQEMFAHVSECGCHEGCPSCVGPISDEGYGGKTATKRLLELLIEEIDGS